MSSERKQILEMLSEGKITAAEAEKLIDAIEQSENSQTDYDIASEHIQDSKINNKPRFLRVIVESKNDDGKDNEKVNIRIPMSIIRAGIKLKSVMPNTVKDKIDDALKEKGINLDFDDIDSGALKNIIDSLPEMHIVVDNEKENKKEKVHIFCE